MPQEQPNPLADSIRTHLGAEVESLTLVRVGRTTNSVVMVVEDAVERRAVIGGINEAGNDFGLGPLAQEDAAKREVIVVGNSLPPEVLPALLRTSLHNIRDHLIIEKDEEFTRQKDALAQRSASLKTALGRDIDANIEKGHLRIMGAEGDRKSLLEYQRSYHPLLKNIKSLEGIEFNVIGDNKLLAYLEIKAGPKDFPALLQAVDMLVGNAGDLREMMDQRRDPTLASAPDIEIADEGTKGVTVTPTLDVHPAEYQPPVRPRTLNPPPKPRRG